MPGGINYQRCWKAERSELFCRMGGEVSRVSAEALEFGRSRRIAKDQVRVIELVVGRKGWSRVIWTPSYAFLGLFGAIFYARPDETVRAGSIVVSPTIFAAGVIGGHYYGRHRDRVVLLIHVQ